MRTFLAGIKIMDSTTPQATPQPENIPGDGKNETPTPESDEQLGLYGYEDAVSSDFARSLERRLSTALADLERARGEVSSKAAQIHDAHEAFARIRTLVGATDRDPMPCETYVERKLIALRSDLAASQQVVEQMRADKERLDWFNLSAHMACVAGGEFAMPDWSINHELKRTVGKGIRAAIDAARAALAPSTDSRSQ